MGSRITDAGARVAVSGDLAHGASEIFVSEGWLAP
jgi:hypothetical protein